MGPRTLIWIAAAALGGLLFTSCGDDAEALSKSDFLEQADAICQEASDDVAPIWDEFFSSYEDEDWDDPALQDELILGLATVVEESAPRWEEQVDELRALVPPSEDEAKLEAMLDDFEAGLAEMQEMVDDAAAGDEEARAALDGDADPMADVNRQAQAYGLRVCGAEG